MTRAIRLIEEYWGSDADCPGLCLVAPLEIDRKPTTQKVFFAEMNLSAFAGWKGQVRKASPALKEKAGDSLIYAEASYLRYRSALFRQNRVLDWPTLKAANIDENYREQTFLLGCCETGKPTLANALGYCLLRRSWKNNLFLDYLARSPRTYGEIRFDGVPPALLAATVFIGAAIESKYLHLEPSRAAVELYSRLFLQEIEDFSRVEVEPLFERFEARFAK